VEEKYGKDFDINGDEEPVDSSSEDETEDEDGELANEDVDAEISATLAAIRSKDPRIYQKDTNFYTTLEKTETTSPREAADRPLYLRDYHRKNLLENGNRTKENGDEPKLPYAQEQAALKASIVQEMHAAGNAVEEGESDDDAFLVRKEKQKSSKTAKPSVPDPKSAERDPETFLSNFFAARAWVPTDTTKFQPLESDDDEEQALAEEFENAWNRRFEDPETTNKSITTHSREVVAKYTVRRKELSGRKKAREIERQRKLEQKKEVEEEKRRLRNLKISDIEQKIEKIRDAAGLSGKSVKIEEWTDLLEGDFEDEEWNQQMMERFGESYYEEDDEDLVQGELDLSKTRKPKWDDDIDIKDLVPEFEDNVDPIEEFRDSDEEKEDVPEKNTSKDKTEAKKQARRDRRIIEALADQSLPVNVEVGESSNTFVPFRYRETSPNTFGLTPLDILAADDSHLNQYAGLKKLATFRDPERKQKDRRKLSKKARLKAWRKDTFGREDGPAPESIYAAGAAISTTTNPNEEDTKPDAPVLSTSGKKRRRKNKKAKTAASKD
jgi:protein KRI1